LTIAPIANHGGGTGAFIAALGVCARRIGVAVKRFQQTFVLVLAAHAVALEASVANAARVLAKGNARRVRMALFRRANSESGRRKALFAILLVSLCTYAFERAIRVDASHVFTRANARVATFVLIGTSDSGAEESIIASANMRADCIFARRFGVAIMRFSRAFVNFVALFAVALKSKNLCQEILDG
jgi:hypothetical protein